MNAEMAGFLASDKDFKDIMNDIKWACNERLRKVTYAWNEIPTETKDKLIALGYALKMDTNKVLEISW